MNYLVSEQLQHVFFIFMHLIKKKTSNKVRNKAASLERHEQIPTNRLSNIHQRADRPLGNAEISYFDFPPHRPRR